MKTLLRFAIFLATFAPALIGAEPRTAAASHSSATDAPSLAGKFIGTWSNETEGGKLRLLLKADGATWTAEASFTFQETEIPTRVTNLKVEGAKIQFVLAWTIEEMTGQSRMIGELSGANIEGTYESETPEGVTNGTWKVTRS